MPAEGTLLVCPKCGSVYHREVEFCGIDGERLIETPDDPLIGREIDRLAITELLGQGGMARVYLAQHRHLDRKVAIKVLLGDLGADRSLVRRFQREAVALSKLHHPNIVEVTDFGQTDDGLVFIVMEYLDGQSLTEVLQAENALSPARAASILKQMALALETAHEQGFVHRDLKPGNVMLVASGGEERVKILDFGIVGLIEGGGHDGTELTAKGQFVGTPAYMSPEQVTGKKVGPASDLYSMGVILYRMVVGRLPFTGELVEVAHKHLRDAPPPPPPDTGELGRLAVELMAKDPADRPPSARAVVDRLERMMGLSSKVPERAPDPWEIDLSDERSAPRTINMRSGDHPSLFSELSLPNATVDAALGGHRWKTPLLVFLALAVGAGAVALGGDYFGLRTRLLPYADAVVREVFGETGRPAGPGGLPPQPTPEVRPGPAPTPREPERVAEPAPEPPTPTPTPTPSLTAPERTPAATPNRPTPRPTPEPPAPPTSQPESPEPIEEPELDLDGPIQRLLPVTPEPPASEERGPSKAELEARLQRIEARVIELGKRPGSAAEHAGLQQRLVETRRNLMLSEANDEELQATAGEIALLEAEVRAALSPTR